MTSKRREDKFSCGRMFPVLIDPDKWDHGGQRLDTWNCPKNFRSTLFERQDSDPDPHIVLCGSATLLLSIPEGRCRRLAVDPVGFFKRLAIQGLPPAGLGRNQTPIKANIVVLVCKFQQNKVKSVVALVFGFVALRCSHRQLFPFFSF